MIRRPPSRSSHNVENLAIDRYRGTVFPNNVREWRKRRGHGKLLALSQQIPEIPYIRLSKIERGEVFAKPQELRIIADRLKVKPEQLLIDIDDPSFDIAEWADHFHDPAAFDPAADELAVLLAAAIRARRDGDDALSIAAIEAQYAIPPVILSRLENAAKTIDRWNDATMTALCRLFDVPDADALCAHVRMLRDEGALESHLQLVAKPELRTAKTRARVAALRDALVQGDEAAAPARAPVAPPVRAATTTDAEVQLSPVIAAIEESERAIVRLVPVFGTPLNDGLIARTATGESIEAPRNAGPHAYGLRVCRPSLGPGLPGRATVIVDPGRFPSAGGLAVVREQGGLRLVSITFSREGRMIGYSAHPDREIAIDEHDPADIATVIAAIYE